MPASGTSVTLPCASGWRRIAILGLHLRVRPLTYSVFGRSVRSQSPSDGLAASLGAQRHAGRRPERRLRPQHAARRTGLERSEPPGWRRAGRAAAKRWESEDGRAAGEGRGRTAAMTLGSRDWQDLEVRREMPFPGVTLCYRDTDARREPSLAMGWRKGEIMAEKYEGYCVKCRTKREFDGEKKELPNGRFAAQGPCPVCGTKVTRMLGKTA